MHESEVQIGTATAALPGTLSEVRDARGVIVFAHGSGSSRFSVRNRAVAEHLQGDDFSTLLFDLLTPHEDRDHENRFDLDLLTQRLVDAVRWVTLQPSLADIPIGLFGASTGAAAALRAAVALGPVIGAVVSRGGRPDLAAGALAHVRAPTLLIVGGADTEVLALNRAASAQLPAATASRIAVVPGATHLFEETGAMDRVAALASEWFTLHLHRGPARARAAAG